MNYWNLFTEVFWLPLMLYVCTQLKLYTLITPVFNAALFAIARTLKQPSCPSADARKKLGYIHTGECHSAIKANAFEWVLMRWASLEPIIQSEMSHKEDKYHLLMHIMILCTGQQRRHGCKEQIFGLSGRGRGWDDLREQHWNIRSTGCTAENQCRVCCMKQGTYSQRPVTVWRDGVERELGRGFYDGGDTRISIHRYTCADS